MSEATASATPRRTPLYDEHVAAGARMVDFAGWAMPVQYRSILEEHRAVRRAAGLFDVCHMGEVEISGPAAADCCARLFTNDARPLPIGRAQYSLLCNESGGVLDDVIVYRLAEERFLVCVNASNAAADFEWIARHAPAGATVRDRSDATGLLALQGPAAAGILARLWPGAPALARFACTEARIVGADVLVARTGYTGEDGFEVFCPAGAAVDLWRALLAAGGDGVLAAAGGERGAAAGDGEAAGNGGERGDGEAAGNGGEGAGGSGGAAACGNGGPAPCGLGARDTLRIEAGLPLYGHELGLDTNPFEAGLGWAVRLNRPEMIGHEALAKVAASGPSRRLVGLLVDGGIAREGAAVYVAGAAAGAEPVGRVTSGTHSPTLGRPVAIALVAAAVAKAQALEVELRGKRRAAAVTRLPFCVKRRPA